MAMLYFFSEVIPLVCVCVHKLFMLTPAVSKFLWSHVGRRLSIDNRVNCVETHLWCFQLAGVRIS